MLQNLHIKNFALIEDLEMVCQQGLNVLTGETGAGKSILIDALNILLGDKVVSVYSYWRRKIIARRKFRNHVARLVVG